MRNKKNLFGIGILLLAVIVGVLGYLYVNANKIAKEILRERVIESYNSSNETKYLISLEEIDLNILTGSVDLLNLSVLPKDSLVTYKRGFDQKTTASASLVIQIGKISLTNFDYVSAFTDRTINVEKFEIFNPSILIYKHLGVTDSIELSQDTLDLKSIFITNYDTFKLGEVLVTDATTTYFEVDEGLDTFKVVTVEHLNYQITEILVTEESLTNSPYIKYKDYSLRSSNLEILVHNKSSIKVGVIDFESQTNSLIVNNIELTPLISPTEFFKQKKYRKAWIKLVVEEVSIRNVEYWRWINSKQLNIESIYITNPELNINTNSNLPEHPTDIKPMLGSLLTSVPIDYKVDSVKINNAQINLDIIGSNSTKHGKLWFDKMDVFAENLTNIDSLLERNPILNLNVETRLNNTGDIHGELKINLLDPKSITKFTVNAKHLKLLNFNTILEPIVLVGITDGEMVSLKISSTLSSSGAQGVVDAHYTNLKLMFKEKDINKETGFFLKVASGLANGIVKSNNIPGHPSYHTGKFAFQKSPKDSFFKMLWLVTMYGLEDSILGSTKKDSRNAKKAEKAKSGGKKSKKNRFKK